ncbi:MAG: hypothetical protein ACTSRI_13135 [Promethearchaeota archaeon]
MGEFLSKEIKKDLNLSIGLIYISIKDDFPDINQDKLSFKNYKYVLQNGLKKRLITLKISNYDEIINKMLEFISEHQSLLTLGTI